MELSDHISYADFERRFKDRKLIGAGGFAQVFKVFDHAKGRYVALKMAPVRADWKKFTLRNEVALVNKLPVHRNIARYDACYRFNTGITGEMDFAILQFYEYGNLEQFLNKHKISEIDKRLIIQGLIDGLTFLDSHNVIHRDLKAQNVLMNRQDGVWTPKITDFGLSRQVEDQAMLTNSAIGLSVHYAAPEQILNHKIYRNVDLWSLGVIIYRIVAGELPFQGRDGESDSSASSRLEISNKIVKCELPDKLNEIEPIYQQIIRRCLVADPKERAQSPTELNLILHDGHAPDELPNFTNALLDISDDSSTITLATPYSYDGNKNEEDKQQQDNVASPPPASNYYVPASNVTQFINPSAQKTPAHEAHADSTEGGSAPEPIPPNSSRSEEHQSPQPAKKKKSSKVWMIFGATLLTASLAVGAWWYYKVYKPSSSNTPHTESVSQVIAMNYYEKMEERIDYASGDSELKKVEQELQALTFLDENKNNYRPHYLLAKVYAYQGRYDDAFKYLHVARYRAQKANQANKLLQNVHDDEEHAFHDIRSLQNGKPWYDFVEPLEEAFF